MIRLLATLRSPRLHLTVAAGWLADVASVTLSAVAHPRRRPWDEDRRPSPDIPGPRRPAD